MNLYGRSGFSNDRRIVLKRRCVHVHAYGTGTTTSTRTAGRALTALFISSFLIFHNSGGEKIIILKNEINRVFKIA